MRKLENTGVTEDRVINSNTATTCFNIGRTWFKQFLKIGLLQKIVKYNAVDHVSV